MKLLGRAKELTHLGEQPLDEESALAMLQSKDDRTRERAREWFENIGQSAGDTIVQRLRYEVRRRKAKQRKAYWVIGIYCALLATLLIAWLTKGMATGRWGDFPWQLFQVFTWIGVFGSAGVASQFQKSAAQLIARFNDKKYVPDLIEALSYKDDQVTFAAIKALEKLLPTLTISDAPFLDTEHRKALHGFLTTSTQEIRLTSAILKALEQIGDERDLPSVRRLAEDVGANSGEDEIIQAAKDCLTFVDQRVESSRAAATLLRASAPVPDSDLLRPAEGIQRIDANTLLRPNSDEAPDIRAALTVEDSQTTSIQT